MSDSTECSVQIKKAVGDAMEFLSEQKQKQLIVNVCALIKAQRNEMQQEPESAESLAISTCGIDDEALVEQERILEEVIAKHHIERAHTLDFGMFQNR
jgi:hypothetical protein